jgi:hypothetical protein
VAARYAASAVGEGAVAGREDVRYLDGAAAVRVPGGHSSTGLSLLLVSDDLLFLHVVTHIAFFAALAAHVGLVLKHQLIDGDRLLHRMT